MASDLLHQKTEGFVITVPSLGKILKWKGVEDTDPRREDCLKQIYQKVDVYVVDTDDLAGLKLVLDASIEFQKSKGKKRELLDAFISAKSKFPRLDDYFNLKLKKKKKSLITQGYKFELAEEIVKDFSAAFGNTSPTKDQVIKFVNDQVDLENKEVS